MNVLLHPTYFPNIATFSAIVQKDILWEVADNYQKQTYRNRCYICTDRGKHLLSIPIQHVGGNHGRQKYKDVKLDNTYQWQRSHWRTLQTAYRTSPFFEYYEDDIGPLFAKKHKFLLDFNFNAIQAIGECFQIEIPHEQTSLYEVEVTDGVRDARFLVRCKNEREFAQEKYTQVFGDRHEFVRNASILDLLFNEGTNTLSYLNNFNLNFLNA